MRSSRHASPARNPKTLARLLLGALAGLPFACAAPPDRPYGSSDGGEGGAGSGEVGSSTGTGDGGSLTVGAGGSGCGNQCSGDLHQVVDCQGNVIETCPDDKGCSPGGACIDPCESAKANESSVGCEFYGVQPSVITQSQGACYAVLLANTWSGPSSIQVEFNGQSLDVNALARVPVGSGNAITYEPLQNGQLGPGQMALLFLANQPGNGLACPAGPGYLGDPSVDGTGMANAFHITTSVPVVAYDIFPYGGAQSFISSATVLVPTSGWGVNYIASDAYEQEPAFVGMNASPFVQIVASTDNTQVTISPTKNIVAGAGVQGAGQGQPTTYTVNRGQVLQFMQLEELAGSPISSDKPVGVWGGSGCMLIPTGQYACDAAHQELLPVKSLGSEYVAVRYRDREMNVNENVPWTIIGAVDGTTLTYDPAPPVGAPATLNNGELVRFSTSDPFTVKSQDDKHPFSLAGHMTGWTNLPSSNLGDAEYVISIPPGAYLRRYLFLTDPTYGTSHLVFVRQKAGDGMWKPVTLDCIGEVGPWQPVGASGKFEYARVDLVNNFVPNGACDNGVHEAKSEAPFGLTVWGWDFAVSYAYPAGMSTRPINTVVVPPVPK